MATFSLWGKSCGLNGRLNCPILNVVGRFEWWVMRTEWAIELPNFECGGTIWTQCSQIPYEENSLFSKFGCASVFWSHDHWNLMKILSPSFLHYEDLCACDKVCVDCECECLQVMVVIQFLITVLMGTRPYADVKIIQQIIRRKWDKTRGNNWSRFNQGTEFGMKIPRWCMTGFIKEWKNWNDSDMEARFVKRNTRLRGLCSDCLNFWAKIKECSEFFCHTVKSSVEAFCYVNDRDMCYQCEFCQFWTKQMRMSWGMNAREKSQTECTEVMLLASCGKSQIELELVFFVFVFAHSMKKCFLAEVSFVLWFCLWFEYVVNLMSHNVLFYLLRGIAWSVIESKGVFSCELWIVMM